MRGSAVSLEMGSILESCSRGGVLNVGTVGLHRHQRRYQAQGTKNVRGFKARREDDDVAPQLGALAAGTVGEKELGDCRLLVLGGRFGDEFLDRCVKMELAPLRLITAACRVSGTRHGYGIEQQN